MLIKVDNLNAIQSFIQDFFVFKGKTASVINNYFSAVPYNIQFKQ